MYKIFHYVLKFSVKFLFYFTKDILDKGKIMATSEYIFLLNKVSFYIIIIALWLPFSYRKTQIIIVNQNRPLI